MHRRFLWVLLLAVGACGAARAEDQFAKNVRTTEPLTPEQEQKALHLPPGFEIQLVASEPDIAKPINMAFDAQGRLWISQSREYPFPAKPGAQARDAIQVLEDFAPEGKARKITKFQAGLNIPIGLYPYQDGAIGYSIPYVSFYHDTNGDGRADRQDRLYGPYGYDKDTHGMTSAFRRGFDGWLYACHGFNNTTTLKGTDGQAFTMQSGNTYRMRLDGSHVEQYTHGQVNPFGLVFDPLGNLYSADCETFPIYQLLRGAYYPSFGKPDDGLGNGPPMMNHKHGSTAIGGIVFYDDDRFPAEFRDNMIVGNVVTCRINRDSLEDHGSTRLAKEQPDFLTSGDPWFRPVDLQLGPDGAIYVADFYNRIIGHYEVPLDHPGRDRERGRIWRIVYRGTAAQAEPHAPNLMTASATELIDALASPNITVRMLAMNQLTDRLGKAAVGPLRDKLQANPTVTQKTHGLWALWRLDALSEEALAAAAHDADRAVRTHAQKILSETKSLSDSEHLLALAGLRDSDGFVRRAAADALGQHPAYENVRPLLELLRTAPSDDTHLIHVARMALRNQLIPSAILAKVDAAEWNAADHRELALMALAIPSTEAGQFLLHHLEHFPESSDTAARFLKQATRYLPAGELDGLARFVRAHFQNDLDFQLTLFKSMQEGLAQRGTPLPASAQPWAEELTTHILATEEPTAADWTNRPYPGAANAADPWVVQKRNSADGKNDLPFLCSLPKGEQLTGILRSKTFEIPSRLSFFVAGHNGQPPAQLPIKNLVRLCDAATGKALLEAPASRNDLAQRIDWGLKEFAGRQGY
ncbi:MAG TPA: PVC-type heme-binding CxxCH protein, partial [Pirellulales bacterium]|nr:PVC-type heme-binding CxxCH protein [Pirellulales bacterium]